MYKVYLAVGNDGVENYIKSQKPLLEKMLNDTVNFVGATVYKEGALQGIKDYHPDVVVLREGLHGSLDILDLIYKIRLESSNTRIIFITKTREVGDAFLATTVQLGVYDIIVGDKISVKDLLKKIVYPTRFVDVAHFIPKVTIDEKTNKKIFSAPDVDALVKQRVDEIAQINQQEAEAAAVAAQPEAEKGDNKVNFLKDSDDAKIAVTLNINKEKVEVEPEIVAEYAPEVNIPVIAPIQVEKNVPALNLQKEDMHSGQSENQEELQPKQISSVQPIALDIEKQPASPVVAVDLDFDKVEEEPLAQPFVQKTDIVPDVFTPPVQDDEDDDFSVPDPIIQIPDIIEETQNNLPEETLEEEIPAVIPIIPVAPLHPTASPTGEESSEYKMYPDEPQLPISNEPVEQLQNMGVIQNEETADYIPIAPIDSLQPQMHNPYTADYGNFQPNNNNSSKKGFTMFKKMNNQRTIPAQIITFWGGNNGVGNSQIAFNTAIALANKGYHVIYVDLNDKFSAVESMMQLGFEDLGIDTMLRNIEDNKTEKVGHAIGSIAKILPFTDKRDFLYKTYTNMPSSLNFAFFSQHCFEGRIGNPYDIERLKDLNLMFLMDFGYDVIILDAPADVHNRATQLALAYANKVFVTLNQDKTVLSRTLKQMKYLSYNRINVREKCFFIVNRFENSDFSYANLSNFISMNLQYEHLELLSIPNLSREFVNSVYNGLPIILSTKNKELLKTIGDIVTLIES